MAKKKKFYAYFTSEDKGVVDSWPECQQMVKGVAGAKYKSFESRDEANRWLRAGADYTIKHIAAQPGIYFDAGTGAGNGTEINVTDARGNGLLWKILPEKKLNNKGHYQVGGGVTNNYGELLACKYALMIAIDYGISKVFGDSALVLNYWSKGHIKNDMPQETIGLAKKVAVLRQKFESTGGDLLKISGGANPADLGFHKG